MGDDSLSSSSRRGALLGNHSSSSSRSSHRRGGATTTTTTTTTSRRHRQTPPSISFFPPICDIELNDDDDDEKNENVKDDNNVIIASKRVPKKTGPTCSIDADERSHPERTSLDLQQGHNHDSFVLDQSDCENITATGTDSADDTKASVPTSSSNMGVKKRFSTGLREFLKK